MNDEHSNNDNDWMVVDGYRVIPSEHYIVSSDGRIAFTPEGREWLSNYFGKAGISLEGIKTYKEYLLARKEAGPYFLEALYDRVAGRPDTGEWGLLKSILIDTPEVYQEKLRKHELRKRLKVIPSLEETDTDES